MRTRLSLSSHDHAGLPYYKTLRDEYRYDEINADTSVFGVVGDPIMHRP